MLVDLEPCRSGGAARPRQASRIPWTCPSSRGHSCSRPSTILKLCFNMAPGSLPDPAGGRVSPRAVKRPVLSHFPDDHQNLRVAAGGFLNDAA
ncbi:MAG: hypothetical protein MZV70_19090 [Desulfobacterales bacterium]|nr:hypothetical protein [Desulfobacterales bacterium]